MTFRFSTTETQRAIDAYTASINRQNAVLDRIISLRQAIMNSWLTSSPAAAAASLLLERQISSVQQMIEALIIRRNNLELALNEMRQAENILTNTTIGGVTSDAFKA